MRFLGYHNSFLEYIGVKSINFQSCYFWRSQITLLDLKVSYPFYFKHRIFEGVRSNSFQLCDFLGCRISLLNVKGVESFLFQTHMRFFWCQIQSLSFQTSFFFTSILHKAFYKTLYRKYFKDRATVITQYLTPYFCLFLEKYKIYFFLVNLVISLFLFYFCVLKINRENYKKYKNTKNSKKKNT